MFSSMRKSTQLTIVAIGIGLLGTVGADIATAATSGGGSNAAAATTSSHQSSGLSSAEVAYLRSLRPVAEKVLDALGPAENVMSAITEPHAGDAFAARDALVHGDALRQLAVAQQELGTLRPPTSFAAHQRGMVSAARQMAADLRQIRSMRSLVNGTRIIAKLDNLSGSKLATAEGKWDAAVEAAYERSNVGTPRDFTNFTHVPVSSTKWIFEADRTCSAASFKLANTRKYANEHTLAGAEKFDRLWARVLQFTGHRLAGLKRPAGASALPQPLRSRLKVLMFNSKVFTHQVAGLKAENLSAVDRAGDQIRELMPSLRVLASELSSYGAHTCGLVINLWSGKRPPASVSHHSKSTVDT